MTKFAQRPVLAENDTMRIGKKIQFMLVCYSYRNHRSCSAVSSIKELIYILNFFYWTTIVEERSPTT